MIKSEIKGDRVEIVFGGTGEEIFKELLETMGEYAEHFLHVSLEKFVDILNETNKQVAAKKAAGSENNAGDEVRQDD